MAVAPKMDLPQTLDLPIPKLITRQYIFEPEFTNVIKPEFFKLGSSATYYKTSVTEIVQDTLKESENKVEKVVEENVKEAVEKVLPAVEDFKVELSKDLKSIALNDLTLNDLTLMHQKITEELKVRVPESVKTMKKFCCFS